MLIFGLTGGIACGKSTVARTFKEAGVPVLDADEICHSLLEPGQPTYQKVIDLLGVGVQLPNRELSKKTIGRLVFSDATLRKAYEAILHPAIEQETQRRFRELEASDQKIACYDAALMVETGHYKKFRPLVVVVCPGDDQVARLMARNNLTREEAELRIQSQAPASEKILAADFIIDNDSTVEELAYQARITLLKVIRWGQRNRELTNLEHDR